MFDLHKLGWHSFQQLSLAVLREILGQTVESFLPSADGGRDGAFTGNWKVSPTEDLAGKFVVQCKHTSKPSYNLTFSDVINEIDKARRLVSEDKCDCYILITNAGVSGTVNEEITTALLGVGVKKIRIFGSTWISEQIQESKRLRMLIPRVYGLGDLGEILDERVYEQAQVLLKSLSEDLSKVVVTNTYHRAVEAINQHGFVLLIGEPAAGKTTIASLLSMSALDQWGIFTMKVENANQVVKHWNPKDPRQFFWVDDAFGVTQYESPLAYEWNSITLKLKAMIRDGVKMVLTSRDYIYKGARKDLKHSAFPLLQESQVVIDVHELSLEERQQILYNHLKLGNQPKEFRTRIKPFLEEISKLPKFVPEIARRLSDSTFTKTIYFHSSVFQKMVDEPTEFLREVIEGLDADSKAALALIYMRNGSLESPIELSTAEQIAIDRLGSSLGGCTEALENMRNSLVFLIQTDHSYVWKFKHPTIGDAYSAIIFDQPELLEIYIQGSAVEEMMSVITCGDIGIQKAVIIPIKFYSLILKKLKQFKFSRIHKTESWAIWEANRRLHSFLSSRCSKEFLELYLQRNPSVLEDIASPGLYLEYSPTVRLVVKLYELKLLPEAFRKKFVKCVMEYTVDGADFHVLESKDIQKVLTVSEYRYLRTKVRQKLIPNLSEWRQDRQSDYSSSREPKDHMDPYLDSLKVLKKAFPQVKFTVQIDSQIDQINEWIKETEENKDEELSPRTKLEEGPPSETFISAFSIFDDIDE